MKTNLSFWENTILNNIDLDGYNLPNNLTDFEKVKAVYNIFKDEYLHANNKHINIENLFCDWLQGLPSCLTIPFYNYEILENAKQYKAFNLVTKKDKDIFLNNYWVLSSKSFFNLLNNL